MTSITSQPSSREDGMPRKGVLRTMLSPTALLALVMSVSLLALGGCSHTVQADIVIAAKPAAVWTVLSDASSFAEWNPVHVRVDGEFREGEQVKVHLRQPSGETTVFDSNVRRVVAERELHQGGGTPGLFTFDHSFTLEPADGGTRVTQREKFAGLGLLFIDMSWAQSAYESVNEALKEAVESRQARPATKGGSARTQQLPHSAIGKGDTGLQRGYSAGRSSVPLNASGRKRRR